ncbi:MAG: OB-fold nucleic acid binding domain-containing protein, partial [Patescibacteria group bacterium]
KKIPAEMEAQREKLIAGAIKHGMDKTRAERLWKLIEPFAAYGFNKAHAASYGRVAYQTAYMKANFPVEYMTAVLTAEAGNIDTVSVMVAECKRIGLPVLPPDVNESFGDFTVLLGGSEQKTKEAAELAKYIEKDSIRFGLYSIKNFGRGVADSIIAERKANGRFTSISDFLRRVKNDFNKRALESLIKCGALDSLGERGAMLASIELLLQYHRDSAADNGHDSLFTGLGSTANDLRIPETAPATQEERLAWEKELLGLYVSGHPLDKFSEKLKKRPMNLAEVKEKIPPGTTAVIAGMIENIRMVLTRNGDQMAFIKIADFDGSIEAVVFPKNFSAYKQILKPESCIALKGRISNRNGELSLVAEALKAL